MKKRILGITALLAVLVMILSFTTCDALLGDKDDGVRSVKFVNHTSAIIEITCQSDDAPSFTLQRATSLNDNDQFKEVTRAGKDIILTTITVTSPYLGGEPWKYIEVDGSAVGGTQKKGKDGLPLKQGTIIFVPTKGLEGGNPAGTWKIDVIPLDE